MQIRYDMIACFVARADASGTAHEILQLRRQRDDYMGGTWQTVHGRIETNETAVQAALRELREETNLAPIEFYQLDQAHIFYIAAQDTLWHCVQFCAIVNASDGLTLNDEHDASRWLPEDKAAEQFMWPGDRSAIAEIRREILSAGPAKKYTAIPLPNN